MTIQRIIKKSDSDKQTIYMDGKPSPRWAKLSQAHRGGCLYCSEIMLQHLGTGAVKYISSTSCEFGQVGDTNAYIGSLWDKHFGAAA